MRPVRPPMRVGLGTGTVLLGLAFLALLAGPACAEEPPTGPASDPEPIEGPVDGATPADDAPAMTAADLEGWIQESPVALWALLLLKYGAAALGLAFLIRAWIRRDRIRAGILPSPEPTLPTTPFSLPTALALLGGSLVFVVLGSGSVAGLDLDEAGRLAVGMSVLQGILLCVAAVVIVRRRQLGAGPRRSVGSVAWGGFRTFCIASTFVIPVMFLSVVVLEALEVPITLYKPVQEVITGEDKSLPWIILALSVVAAPIAEESIFRGMLYPAIRSAVGPRGGVLLAAVLTSTLFALIHWHAASFLPLFTLAMVFAWVFERTNSLAMAIGAHALWNASTMLPLLLRGMA